LLENLPTQRTQGVTGVNGKNGEDEEKKIGATQGVEKLCAAEIAEMKEAARAVNDKSQDTKPNNRD
jgi:hypothetical protein